jgi:hypothetical protein
MSMSKFEDHLWREFVREHGDVLALQNKLATGHALRTRELVAGAGLGLAGGITALALVLSATSTPAFAVTRNPNGTVTVTIRSASGIAGANAELHQLGIRAQVMATAPAGCRAISATAQQAVPPGAPAQSVTLPRGTTNVIAQWTINPSALPARQSVVLTPPPAGNSGNSGATGNSGTNRAGNSGNSGSSGTNPAGNSGNSGSAGGSQAWTCWSSAGHALARSPAGNS